MSFLPRQQKTDRARIPKSSVTRVLRVLDRKTASSRGKLKTRVPECIRWTNGGRGSDRRNRVRLCVFNQLSDACGLRKLALIVHFRRPGRDSVAVFTDLRQRERGLLAISGVRNHRPLTGELGPLTPHQCENDTNIEAPFPGLLGPQREPPFFCPSQARQTQKAP
jgi:hypothetical protein